MRAIHMYVHDLATPKQIARFEQELKNNPSTPHRPPKGPKIGVFLAVQLSDTTYSVNVSLVHPGKKKIHNGISQHVGFDIFEKDKGLQMAMDRAHAFAPLPKILVDEIRSKRSQHINTQWGRFLERAAATFKDKTRTGWTPPALDDDIPF
jgi:hypothetical protein